MSNLPEGIVRFLANSGWEGAAIEPLTGDASFRRYFRLRRDDSAEPITAMLMYAPPPHEDPEPFLNVARWLEANGMRGPSIFAAAPDEGWVLLEDFGDDRMRDWLDENPEAEWDAYQGAIDALVALHQLPAGPFPPYDMETYCRETRLLIEWYAPAMGLSVDEAGYEEAWRQVLAPVLSRQAPGVTVLRDYHAENIMLLGDPRDAAPQGLIDFQDALVGHPAYDLVSLLQDARRDVDQDLAARLLDYYRESVRQFDSEAGQSGADSLIADYAVLGAQRNAKIVGIFTRLHKRDGKPRYLDMIPRVWRLMEDDLVHPALEPVARWFDANIPAELRQAGGGQIA